jgi:hypothetical protein
MSVATKAVVCCGLVRCEPHTLKVIGSSRTGN